MSSRLQSHFFWGPHSPLATLSGAGFIIMASSRLAYALFCAGAVLWVYSLSVLIFHSGRKYLPQKGKPIIVLFLTSFVLSIYMLLLGLLNPLLITATWFMLVFICPCCVGSGYFEDSETGEIEDILPHVLMEAGVISLLMIAVSLVREPVGLGTLSFPGGPSGIIELFGGTANDGEAVFPVRFLSIAAGGFLILGFVAAGFRYFLKLFLEREEGGL